MSKLFVSLLLLQLIVAAFAGSCVFGEPGAPSSLLRASGTMARVSGAGLQVHPITDLASGAYLEDEYIRSEVLAIRELPLDGAPECVNALDQTSLEHPHIQSLNLSLCDCTHSEGTDYFVDGTTRRDFVRVNISCPEFPGTSLRLDVSVVDAPYNVSHPTLNGSIPFIYDRYRPDEIKFNVTVENWPWSMVPDAYGTIFISTTVNVPGATLSTNTSTEELQAIVENDHVRFLQRVQRGFVFDGFGYITEVPSTYTDPFVVEPHFQLLNGIALCFDKQPIPSYPKVVTYDPTLSTLFFGDPPPQGSPEKKSNNNIALKVALPVVLITVAAVLIFVAIAYNTPALKNYFRPFRNPDKDGSLVSM
jgi:hypothetical protein